MKKFLSLLLAAMMVASLLTGCGDDTAADTNTDADAGNTETAQTNWNVSSTTGSGTELKFRTGGDQGTYYGFGSVWPRPSPPTATAPRSRPWSAMVLRTTSSRWT